MKEVKDIYAELRTANPTISSTNEFEPLMLAAIEKELEPSLSPVEILESIILWKQTINGYDVREMAVSLYKIKRDEYKRNERNEKKI
ncbi:hypothetical protein [Pricia sp.]|uniref:hypothetical protein n=1 Tax=Pricia sp. TaxID=2268138 RepID=UPI0035942FE2